MNPFNHNHPYQQLLRFTTQAFSHDTLSAMSTSNRIPLSYRPRDGTDGTSSENPNPIDFSGGRVASLNAGANLRASMDERRRRRMAQQQMQYHQQEGHFQTGEP